jgi:hypothetical protein
MTLLRAAALALASASCSFALVSALSCGTDAVGIDDCREIEQARCEAAGHCGGELRVQDVEACKRYYRDHCLHGLGVEDEPGAPLLNACLRAIEAAGNCAKSDPEMTVEQCASTDQRLRAENAAELRQVCDVIQFPELTVECAFLREPDPLPSPAEAGAAEAGTEGTAGAAGSGGQGG